MSEDATITREVLIDAPPEEVWEAVSTEEGREAWLEPGEEVDIQVESEEEPHRLVWWWWQEDEAPRRVALTIVAVPRGSRVIVTEAAPEFPLARLQAAFSRCLALA
jgi:uncharacterized protein YndB with AHSA1/START domain